MKYFLISAAILSAVLDAPVRADDQPAPAAPLATPAMFGPLALNPDAGNIDAGPLGQINISGIVSGLGLWQDHHAAGDANSLFDLSNAQLFIQKTDGLVQFYLQVGEYTLPSVGSVYQRSSYATDHFFSPVPVAYVKLAPSDDFSIMVGKLYTLIGTENTFDFENADIEHGLLWNQTNDVSRGVQVNYSLDRFSLSVALTDGFYSSKPNWLSGTLTYAIDPDNSLTVLASGNFQHDDRNSLATPVTLNNSQLAQINYSYTAGPLVLSPTLQWTHVPRDEAIGLAAQASTYGAGATAKYAIDSSWSMAGRVEFIDSTGGANVTYGPGSKAWSLTLTPTWQQGMFFARPEISFVKAVNAAPGAAFGIDGERTSQVRGMLEAGILF